MRIYALALCLAILSPCSNAKNFQTLTEELKFFADTAHVTMPGKVPGKDGAGPNSVAERILTGFQQDPPRQLQLEDGSAVYWGWQEGQAFVMSVAVYDPEGQIRLLGAVDDIPRLYNRRSRRGISSEPEYRELLRKQAKWGSSPSVVLFTRDDRQLSTYLPLVKRWLQAAMLGFNVDCDKSEVTSVCTFVETVSLPTLAFSLECEAAEAINQCALPVPKLSAAAFPLGNFRQ